MKNTQKHTQGPWKLNYPLITAQGDMALTVAVVLCREDNNARADSAAKTKGEAEANARLIATAPDLLTALNEVLGDLCDFQEAYPDLSDQFDGTFAKINAVLAKAEGVK